MARMTEMPAPPSFAPGTPGRFWGLVPCAGTGSRAVPAGAAADLHLDALEARWAAL